MRAQSSRSVRNNRAFLRTGAKRAVRPARADAIKQGEGGQHLEAEDHVIELFVIGRKILPAGRDQHAVDSNT